MKILNQKIPEELASQLPLNTNGMRIATQNKLAKKPKWIGKTKITRGSYRNRAYKYNTLPGHLTEQKTYHKLKKELKKYMLDHP